MKVLIFFSICTFFYKIQYAVCSEYVSQNLNEYLANKSEFIFQNFSRKSQTRREIRRIEVKQFNKTTVPLEPNEKYYKTNLLDTEFLITKNKLLYHDNVNNRTVMEKLTSIINEEELIYTRLVQFNQLRILLTASNSKMSIYGFNGTKNYFVQKISTPEAVDAQFFVNNGKLHLIISSTTGDILMPTSVYQWLGTYFDEIQTIFIRGASKIITFQSGSSEIIIILQHTPDKQVYSTVCEYNCGKLIKLQHIHTDNPIHAKKYKFDKKVYVVIFEKSENNKIYEWNENALQLTPISVFKTPTDVNKSAIVQYNNSATIFIPLVNKLQVYLPYPEGFKLEKEEMYGSNCSKIIDILTISDKDSAVIFLICLTESETVDIFAFYFRINSENNSESTNQGLRSCFNDLEHKVYNIKKLIREFKERVKVLKNDIIYSNKTNTKGTQRTAEEDPDFEENFKELWDKVQDIEPFLNEYKNLEGDDLIINGITNVNGFLEAEKLTGKDINVKKINGHKWTPEQWLTYKEPQTISGPATIRHIKTKDLIISKNDNIFTDILTKNASQEISGRVTIRNLTANELFAKKINDVPLEDLYLKNNPEPVRGLKTFKNIRANGVKMNLLNGKAPDDVLSLFANSSSRIVLDPQLEVENLIVEWIDDVHLDTFNKSVYKIGKTPEIRGNLTFSGLKTKKLSLTTLNGVKVEDFLTTSTDQIIDSHIEFTRIFAENINSNTTNNINLEDVVRFGDNRTVEGPVKFDSLYVRNNLELIGKLDKDFFFKNGGHIIGTNESDLLQTYKGKVKIKGNLYLSNMTLEPEAKLIISDEEFNPNISDVYWTKSTHQAIPVRFQALNGVSTPHLLTDMINNVKIGYYMLNNDQDKLETSFHFTNVTVAGNIMLNNNARHVPDLNMINKNSVKTNGSFVINGKKKYTDTLRVKNLITNVLDHVIVYDVLTKKWSGVITGKKTFEKVIVKGNLTSDLSLESINNVHLKQLAENTIYIDQPQDLNRLHFKNITVSNLYVSRLNDYHMNEYILNLEKLYSSNKIHNLKVEGNVYLKNVTDVEAINDIVIEDLNENALEVHPTGAFIADLKFSHLKVNNLLTRFINDVNLPILTRRQFIRTVNQTVTAPFSFNKIKTRNIVVSKINDISVKNLVDVSSDEPQTIYAPNGVEFSSVKLMKSLKSNETSPCDFKEAQKKIRDPPSFNWSTVTVNGNVTFLDPENVLYRIVEKTVNKNSENVVQSPVNITNHISAKNVVSMGNINGVILEDIIYDAVVADTDEEQVITGSKIFSSIKVSSARVDGNTDTPVINSFDIPVINKSLVRKNEINGNVIRGKKTFFSGVDAIRFYSKKVANTDMDHIVSLDNLKKIPKAIIETAEVENNLNISRINFMPFGETLEKRLLTDQIDEQVTKGVYYFDNIEVENIETPSINKIKMDDVVFDIDNQDISGAKRFWETIEIYGNIRSDYINGIDVTKSQKNSVIGGETSILDGSITLLQPSVVKGNITAESINGYPLKNLKEILSTRGTRAEEHEIRHIKDNITQMVKKNHQIQHKDDYRTNIKHEMPTEYMYLEKSDVLQISVPNTVTAKTMTTKGYVLVHITGEESGEYCGLPRDCRCPVQYTMEVSPEHSVAVFLDKDVQRTFSYSDENMIIHFKTNSISTDTVCRTKTARVLNEVSVMSWTTLPTENTTGTFYQYDKLIMGYISGTEFFTLNGRSYAIIGRFYDPIADTHNLDCVVIRFSDDKTQAKEIQRIPSKGVWSLYLFHTAQGVTLVIGNIGNAHGHFEEEETVIYRFDEYTQQFVDLRRITSYGSSMATGVVLGADSLIVLAHKSVPLQVLKYNHHYDNYYFYQSFELESPVQGISVFYTGGFGISDAYLCIVTKNEYYFIYSFQFIEGWKLESSGEMEGLRNLIPFELNNQPYLFAPSTKMSSLLTVVKHGSV